MMNMDIINTLKIKKKYNKFVYYDNKSDVAINKDGIVRFRRRKEEDLSMIDRLKLKYKEIEDE